MKKLLLLLAISVMLVFVVAACTTTPPPAPTTPPPATTTPDTTTPPATTTPDTTTPAATDDSWQKIQAKGYFVLGLDDSFPPMGFRDENNEIVGFDIDMAKAAAQYLGVDVQLKPVIWDTVILSLTSGDIDCIWNGMSVTPQRLESINVSDPYIRSSQIIVTLAGSALHTKADLAGKDVGTQMGSSTLDALNADPDTLNSFKELHQYSTFTEAMMDLENKRLDAVVIDSIAFYGDFNVKSPGKYQVMDENFGTEDMAIGVRKEDNTWREKLNEAMQALKDNGTAAQISDKWFGDNIVI